MLGDILFKAYYHLHKQQPIESIVRVTFRLSAYLILSYTLPDQEIHLSPFYINNRDCSHTIWHFKSIAATQAKGSGSLGKEKFLLTN